MIERRGHRGEKGEKVKGINKEGMHFLFFTFCSVLRLEKKTILNFSTQERGWKGEGIGENRERK